LENGLEKPREIEFLRLKEIKHLRSIFVHVDLVKAVGKQLEVLEAYGLVEFTGKGWRWKG